MVTLELRAVLSDPEALLNGIGDIEVFAIGDTEYLYIASEAGGGMTAYRLDEDGLPVWIDTLASGDRWTYTNQTGELLFAEVGNFKVILPLGGFNNFLSMQRLTNAGEFHSAWVVAGETAHLGWMDQGIIVTQGDQQFLYSSQIGQSGLEMFRIESNLSLTHLGELRDTDQSHLTAPQDLGQITIAGHTFLFVTDGVEHGLTSYQVMGDGTLNKADAIAPPSGLWVNAPTAMVTIDAGPMAYMVLASAGNSALTVIRITPWGTMTPVEQLLDSRDTRFEGVTALEQIEVGGRHFIIAGGGDDGITLLELTLDGNLYHHTTLADTLSTTLANVSAIQAVVLGDSLQIFVGGSEDGVTLFEIDLTTLGDGMMGSFGDDTLTGTGQDDMIVGGAGNDFLLGRNGDDVLIDGTGSDTLQGGQGADTFVMVDDNTEDRINGFQVGWDRIDMTDYPLLYDMDRLTFTQEGNALRISYAGDTLVLEGPNGTLITQAMLDADNFVFY